MFPFLFISTQNFNSLFFVYLLRAPYHSERTRVMKYLLSCVVLRASLLGSESFDPLAIAQPEVWDRRATIDRDTPLVTSASDTLMRTSPHYYWMNLFFNVRQGCTYVEKQIF